MIFPALNLYLLCGFPIFLSGFSSPLGPWAPGNLRANAPAWNMPDALWLGGTGAEPGCGTGAGRTIPVVRACFGPSIYILVGGFKHGLHFPFHVCPLTNSYFSRWLLHHQPVSYVGIILHYPRIPWFLEPQLLLWKSILYIHYVRTNKKNQKTKDIVCLKENLGWQWCALGRNHHRIRDSASVNGLFGVQLVAMSTLYLCWLVNSSGLALSLDLYPKVGLD